MRLVRMAGLGDAAAEQAQCDTATDWISAYARHCPVSTDHPGCRATHDDAEQRRRCSVFAMLGEGGCSFKEHPSVVITSIVRHRVVGRQRLGYPGPQPVRGRLWRRRSVQRHGGRQAACCASRRHRFPWRWPGASLRVQRRFRRWQPLGRRHLRQRRLRRHLGHRSQPVPGQCHVRWNPGARCGTALPERHGHVRRWRGGPSCRSARRLRQRREFCPVRPRRVAAAARLPQHERQPGGRCRGQPGAHRRDRLVRHGRAGRLGAARAVDRQLRRDPGLDQSGRVQRRAHPVVGRRLEHAVRRHQRAGRGGLVEERRPQGADHAAGVREARGLRRADRPQGDLRPPHGRRLRRAAAERAVDRQGAGHGRDGRRGRAGHGGRGEVPGRLGAACLGVQGQQHGDRLRPGQRADAGRRSALGRRRPDRHPEDVHRRGQRGGGGGPRGAGHRGRTDRLGAARLLWRRPQPGRHRSGQAGHPQQARLLGARIPARDRRDARPGQRASLRRRHERPLGLPGTAEHRPGLGRRDGVQHDVGRQQGMGLDAAGLHERQGRGAGRADVQRQPAAGGRELVEHRLRWGPGHYKPEQQAVTDQMLFKPS